jgi:hypothetical protein
MENKNIIAAPEIFGKIKDTWTERDFKFAIKKFRQNAPAAPIPRLYDAYKWLKDRLDTEDEESNKQFTHFVELFLRTLEERGAGDSGVYSEVLRDSAEYKYLKGLFHNEESADEAELIDTAENLDTPAPVIKKLLLKDILLKKSIPLIDIDINSWHKLIDEYFRGINTEESFVKSCSSVVNNISKRTVKETYHVEIIIVYAFDKLLRYKKLSLKSKNFAMQLLNLMTSKGEIWSRLHGEYLEIIKK